MRVAIALARRALGRAWPNPAVGCVIVADGEVVGRGHTADGGRPHAEAVALRRAGGRAAGATAYVSLEPCAHYGKTPPCADALAAAGVARVVAAISDPDPRVDGGGFAKLRAAGVAVETGLCAGEAEGVLDGFRSRTARGRPLVSLKLASTLDSRIATRTGESRWITGETARRSVHLLRARHDAILIGARTALLDDPALTCRLSGLEDASPVRVLVDGAAALPRTHDLIATASATPTWLILPRAREARRRRDYDSSGVKFLPVVAQEDGRIDPAAALTALGGEGITSVLVEGGAGIAASLLRAGLIDRLIWYRAPRLIGGDGREAVEALGVDTLDAAKDFAKISIRSLGPDLVETYRPA